MTATRSGSPSIPSRRNTTDEVGGGGGGGRQEGGLLPPLLALVPSTGGHSNPSASPPSMKLDYMCNPGDHLSSQYLPDGAMDYY